VPRGSLTDDFVSNAEVPPYDKLKLDEHEKARLAIPDKDLVWVEWVHTMRAPVLDEAGEPIPTNTPGKGGKTRAGWATDFVGAFKCYGRDEELRKNRIDPDRCPGCAAAARGVRDMEPERRFALPVIRYDTVNKGTTQLRAPAGAKILIWTLTQKMYDKLMDQRAAIRDLLEIPEGTEVTLKEADIVVECESKDFQRLVYQAPMRPAWRDARVSTVIRELWGNVANRPTDDQLLHAVVKPKERRWAEADVEDHEARWAAADRARGIGVTPGTATAGGPVTCDQSADTGLDELLAETPGQPAGDPFADAPAAAAPPPPGPPADDPFAGTAVAEAAPDPGPGGLGQFAPAEPATAAASSPAAEADPFADTPSAAAPANGTSAAVPAPAAAGADPFADVPATAPAATANGNGAAGAKSFDEIFQEAQGS
jgi:hypothetical protein